MTKPANTSTILHRLAKSWLGHTLVVTQTTRTWLLVFSLCLVFVGPTNAKPKPEFLIVGTGGLSGIYYPAGSAICRIVNRYRKQQGIRCSVESTRGSVANLNTLGSGDIDLAIAQSDTQFHAYNGTDVFADMPANRHLRTLFNLHVEPFTVVVSERSGIQTFDDLKGKRVSIGRPGSGQRQTMQALMTAKGWQMEDFDEVHELTAIHHARALCDDAIDAFVYTVGHPAGSITEAADSCKIKLISVSQEAVNSLVAQHSYYQRMRIASGIYRGVNRDTDTLGVRAALIASTATSEDTIYHIVKDVFENLDSMQKMHPAFEALVKQEMVPRNPQIPLHEGAIRYFREAGLLKSDTSANQVSLQTP
ncbi:C4-dicarboxylate ABC transporter substrate-binding protein [Arenicella chitinivorans]|uniref:C4-dicarboxylate ABC transporter substrate-binding protein n=1 Tax=Arenicella chitinivorans TaxID=1329800 RepID=A0A918RTL4_9GAMM|nr:TAXI family TRAP transporter solute-binding subunit [Arenicella chitinivorans]GHA10652.1 C4-dicarboxylate ABC transporter substrate-binding protein [Arenicella chitinivorans]